MKIALLGCGTVGGGVLRLLARNGARYMARCGVPLEVRRVLVRDTDKPRVDELDRGKLTTDASLVLDDPEVDIFVEVMGGEDFAGECVERAIKSGRSVVTANKALLAKRGPALFELASRRGVDLAFEAAVGGGIPVVRALRDSFASDEVLELVGILNGTSNYILTRMTEDGCSFDDALAEAQARGYAEADPSLDVDGHDAAQKLVLLAMLAFGARPPYPAMTVEGIRGLERVDVELAAQLGYSVKHLVVGRAHGAGVELRAHPTLVRRSSVLSNISLAQNAILVEGRALGPCLFTGRGAGDMPTAVSVVADILDVARSVVAGVPGLVTAASDLAEKPLVPAEETTLRYYVRLTVSDQPGVMAKVAGAFAGENVSLSQIIQSELANDAARVVIVTHAAREGSVRRALAQLEREVVDGGARPLLAAPPRFLRIEDR
ncbi:MAG: homoserine dehydrogenase [Polyangiaceae bacterium]